MTQQGANLIEQQSDIEYDVYLDAKGLNCPLPILKTKLELNRMQANEIILVDATDPHAIIDFEAYCARTEHEILRIDETDEQISFYIKRAEEPKPI